MKLQEKIYCCRKKAGLSQEALAEKLGVSRQAVSKWETGDAVPELGKLSLLAKTFGVSADWLLSEDAPEEPETGRPSPSETQDILERLPSFFSRLFRRYGWLAGIYLAVIGALFTAMGALTRHTVRQMFTGFGGEYILDDTAIRMISRNPVSILGTFSMVLGGVLLLGGIILAVVLKRRERK